MQTIFNLIKYLVKEMGRHKEWRKTVKKLRRSRIRRVRAKKRHEKEEEERTRRETSPSYIKWCKEQEEAELFQEQEELRIAKENEQKWLEAENEAQKQWRELQKKVESIREERRKQEEKIRQEWQREQQKIKEIKERNQKLKEENERRVELLKQKIDEYIQNGGDIPEELNISVETNPNKPPCPFFQKTAACRYKDLCSRNHIRPGISKILLFPSFYSHFSLEQSNENEYGSDLILEYEDRETYSHFCDFFEDILPEFEKCGFVRQVKVCCNTEAHLRGNVYVEYSTLREALRAYKMFQGRWYGGKQLNVEFCNISSWKNAICGLSYRNKCPKGSSCNFLHVFENPVKMFQNADRDLHRTPSRKNMDSSYNNRHWRWSESPERDVIEKENWEKSSEEADKEYKKHERQKRRRSSRSNSRRSKSSPNWSSKSTSERSERSTRSSKHSRKKHKHSS